MRRLALVILLSLAVAACGGDDDSESSNSTTTESTSSSTTSSSSTTAVTDDGSTSPSTSTDESSTSSTLAPPSDDELPGEVIDIYPYADANLAVVGVDRDDVLNMRSGPGVDFGVVKELPPLETGIVATGHNRLLDDSMWVQVTKDGVTGWANVTYLLQIGATNDITEELRDPAGNLPGGETMVDLANAVGELQASEEPPSRIVIVEAPQVGEKGTITVDVIGFGDDAVGGERLHIVATPITEAFVVESIERTPLCSRGVSDDGLCV